MIDLLYAGYDSLEYVDSWNQPVLLRYRGYHLG